MDAVGGTTTCRGNYELHTALNYIGGEHGETVRNPKKGRARPNSGRTANRHFREMSRARNNAQAQAGETEGLRKRKVQDARTEKKAKQLLWDFWPLRDKKFRRTVFHCHPSSSMPFLPEHALRKFLWVCIVARCLNIQMTLSGTACMYVNTCYIQIDVYIEGKYDSI